MPWAPSGPADATGSRLDRRSLLRLGSAAALSAAAVVGAGSAFVAPAAAAVPQWPGHKPGRIYLGAASYPNDISQVVNRTGPLGMRRTFYKWGDGAREDKAIRADHAARRMPWISFKPPSTSPGGWRAVSSGKHDAELRARARRYAGYSQPVVVTFNHEPHNDSTGTPAEFIAAWARVHDVMRSETGLKNVVSAPIIGEWVFNPVNRRHAPEQFINQGMLDRCHFLGVDLYQMKSGQAYDIRLGRVVDWLDAKGYSNKMVGVGETGATNAFGRPTGAEWWTSSWKWAAANTGRVGAISYFDTLHNNNAGLNWLLAESSAKLSAFRASATSSVACVL